MTLSWLSKITVIIKVKKLEPGLKNIPYFLNSLFDHFFYLFAKTAVPFRPLPKKKEISWTWDDNDDDYKWGSWEQCNAGYAVGFKVRYGN